MSGHSFLTLVHWRLKTGEGSQGTLSPTTFCCPQMSEGRWCLNILVLIGGQSDDAGLLACPVRDSDDQLAWCSEPLPTKKECPTLHRTRWSTQGPVGSTAGYPGDRCPPRVGSQTVPMPTLAQACDEPEAQQEQFGAPLGCSLAPPSPPLGCQPRQGSVSLLSPCARPEKCQGRRGGGGRLGTY